MRPILIVLLLALGALACAHGRPAQRANDEVTAPLPEGPDAGPTTEPALAPRP
jgi:hypothetical protein